MDFILSLPLHNGDYQLAQLNISSTGTNDSRGPKPADGEALLIRRQYRGIEPGLKSQIVQRMFKPAAAQRLNGEKASSGYRSANGFAVGFQSLLCNANLLQTSDVDKLSRLIVGNIPAQAQAHLGRRINSDCMYAARECRFIHYILIKQHVAEAVCRIFVAVAVGIIGLGFKSHLPEGICVHHLARCFRVSTVVQTLNVGDTVYRLVQHLLHLRDLVKRHRVIVDSIGVSHQIIFQALDVRPHNRRRLSTVKLFIRLGKIPFVDGSGFNQQVQQLHITVCGTDCNGGHLAECNVGIVYPVIKFPKQVVQLILIPDIIFLHGFRVITKDFQR